MSNTVKKRMSRTLAAIAVGAVAICAARAQTGDASRGEYLYTDGYKCYACHGFDGQSGARRLVPMNYPLEGFTTIVRNSPFPQMPSFNDVSEDDLRAIYEYIGTIPVDAPAVEDLDLLNDIARRKRGAFDN